MKSLWWLCAILLTGVFFKSTDCLQAQKIKDFSIPGATFHVQFINADTVLVIESHAGGGSRTRRMRYYADNANDSDDSLFYFQLAQRRTIENVFIESLNLMKLESFNAILLKLNLPHPLRFNDCIIYNTESPPQYQSEKPERIFSKTVEITNCIIRENIDFANSTFVDSFVITNTRIGGMLDLSDCKFRKPVIIDASGIYTQLSLSNSRTLTSFELTNSFVSDFDAQNCLFNLSSGFGGTVFSERLSLFHARFRGKTDLSNTNFSPSMSFYGASFSGYTYLSMITIRQNETSRAQRQSFDPDILLSKANISDTVNADDNILSYGMDLISLKQIWFDLDTMEPIDAERFLNSLIQYVNSNSNASEGLREESLARLNYQAVQLKRSNTESWFERAKLDFLQLVVRNGYGGGGQFVISCLLVTLFFSVVYQLKYPADIAALIETDKQETKNLPAPAGGTVRKFHTSLLKSILNFVQSMWFSVYVFLSPKFPSEIFPRTPSFQLVASLEWGMGICMMIIYFVYIASNYGFIRSLLGF